MATDTTTDPNIATLEPLMIRDIENLLLTKQLADTEAKLAQSMMIEAQRKVQQAVTIEAGIMAKLEKQTGRKLLGKIELLDREKGLARLT